MVNTAEQKKDEQFQSLLETVERLRHEKFPHLDAELIREILRLHADGGASDGELSRGAEQIDERHLVAGVSPCCG